MARLIRTEKEVEGRFEEVWIVVEEDPLEQWPEGPRDVVGKPATRKSGSERVRVRRAEDGSLEHPGKADVGGVARPAAHPLRPGLARRGPADDRQRPRRPLLERILLDDDPDLLEPPFDLLLGPDQSCHVRIASSILG